MNEIKLKIIVTTDGSHSLLREDINETYHSFHGAKGESDYVFIQSGLDYLLAVCGKAPIKVFEVGMGTGLNALLSSGFARKHAVALDYHTIEPIPVREELYTQFNYGNNEAERERLQQIHRMPWERQTEIDPLFKLTKYETTLEQFDRTTDFDIIFFDAFAPSKQPEVWSFENIKKCFDLLRSGGILTTYCAQGQFKRNLKEAGFEVETLPGAMGKKEMVRARRP